MIADAYGLTQREREVTALVIQGLSLAGGKLFVRTLEDVRSRVRIHGPDGAPAGEIAFPALGTVSGVQGRWTSPQAFFSFTSFGIGALVDDGLPLGRAMALSIIVSGLIVAILMWSGPETRGRKLK